MHYVVYFNFSGISDNICLELHVAILIELRRWRGKGVSRMEIGSIYQFNYNVLDTLKLSDPY